MNNLKQFFDDDMLATHVELLETYLIDVIGRMFRIGRAVSLQQYLRELQPFPDIEFFREVNEVSANESHCSGLCSLVYRFRL